MPASRRGEWEHLLAISLRSDAPRCGTPGDAANAGARSIASRDHEAIAKARREQRQKLEEYLDRNHGECFLRDLRVAALLENAMRFHHGQRFELLGWVVMPNHVHALLKVGDTTPLTKIIQNWKSISAVAANKMLNRSANSGRKTIGTHSCAMRSRREKPSITSRTIP
ncbi:MAG: transposase [Verrucomicrobiota bacterium]